MNWPPVFDGIGAMFVRTDNDPEAQLARIKPTPTWVAVKVNGGDVQTMPEIKAWLERVHAAHPSIVLGVWVYNYGPPEQDVRSWQLFYNPAFVIYDVEAEYKVDEAGAQVATWPAQLVTAHPASIPAAVTSYGAIPGMGNFPSSIDFAPFARSGWPVLAQLYDDYDPITHPEMQDCQDTYLRAAGTKYPGPYPPEGVHEMYRRLTLRAGQAVYRPEGIDS